MPIPPPVKKRLPLIIFGLVLLILAAVFFMRSPVLIVTDSYFERIYGKGRLRFRGIWTSLELFRPVISVEVAVNAGPDLIALAAAGHSASPWAVFFPYRYMEAALYYLEMHPNIPVLVMTADNPGLEDTPLITFVRTDTRIDMFRAGLYAKVLAGEEAVLFVSERGINEDLRSSFLTGLAAKHLYRTETLFYYPSMVFPSHMNIGCMVSSGDTGIFIEQNVQFPLILFSWADPAYTPRTVKLLFDDTPWAMAKDALRNYPPAAGELIIPSKPLLLFNRMENKSSYFRHMRLLREKI